MNRIMLIFIYGQDGYRSRQKMRELVDAFRKKHDPSGLNIARIDGTKTTADELGAAVNTPGFLSSRRMVVVDDLLTSKRGREEIEGQFVPLFKNHLDSTVIVLRDDLSEDKVKAHPVRKSLAGAPKDKVVDYHFAPLERREVVWWINDEVKRRSVTIEPKAAELLAALVGNDLWRLSSELDKLTAQAGGKPILARDVGEMVRGTVEENIFAFVDAVAARDLGRASALLRDQLSAGLEELYLLSMLIRQFRLLLIVTSFLEEKKGATKAAMAGELGLHPFVAGKLLAQVRTFSRKDLERSFVRLFALERSIKTGRLSPGAALDLFLGSLVPA